MTVTVQSLTKSVTKEGVRVFKEWGAPESDPFLSAFLNTKASTKQRRSPEMQALGKCNLLYVVQSRADRTNHIYKIGVSKGVGRLHEYVKHHGEPDSTKAPQKGRCVGVFLVYLAGQMRKDATSKSTTAGKRNADTVDSYATYGPWTRRKEKLIFEELKSQGLEPVRGKEWYHVEDAAAVKRLKRNVEKTTGMATNDRAARFEKDMHLNKDDKLLSVESMDLAKHGPNKGKFVYKLKWDRPFPQTRNEIDKQRKKTSVEPATLKLLYDRETQENQSSPGRGTAAIEKVHDYLKKLKKKDPDQRLKRRGVGYGQKLRQLN